MEVGRGRQPSWTSNYQTGVLREYLDIGSPAKTFDKPSKLTKEESLNVDSAEFRSPGSSSPRLPIPLTSFDDSTGENDRHLLYFLRDAVEHLFSQGKSEVTFEDLMEVRDSVARKVGEMEVKSVFSLAEDGSGRITRTSFHHFWSSQHLVSSIPLSSFPSAFISRLRGVYTSFLPAYEDITQGGEKALDTEQIKKLGGNLGLEVTDYDCLWLLGSEREMSLHRFKTVWLNEGKGDGKYCVNKYCGEKVGSEGGLCRKHRMFIQSQGSYVWTMVKSSLPPRRMVELISELHSHKESTDLSPSHLRRTLSRYLPLSTVPPKHLSVLSDYLKMRITQKEPRTHRKPDTPGLLMSPGVMTERRQAAFYHKATSTPAVAGFPKSATSHKSKRFASSKERYFRFPYPIRQPSPT